MKKEIIKPFDLASCKNGAKVKTRDGHEVRIICTDAKDKDFPIIGLVTSCDGNEYYYVNFRNDEPIFEDCIYAWSLAALLDVLPNKLQIALAINDFQGDRKEKYVIGSVEHDKYDCYADNPVDACYELILKLHELKML
jgi:hypothetical protein